MSSSASAPASWMRRAYVTQPPTLLPFKLVPVYYSVSGGPDFPPIAPPGYHVAIGQSPRSDKHTHACVALDGKIVFDPHPTRAGFVGEIASWILLMPLLESSNGA